MQLTKNQTDYIKIAETVNDAFSREVFIPALRQAATRNGLGNSDSALSAIIKMGFILEQSGVEPEEIKSADTATVNSIERLVNQAAENPVLRSMVEAQSKAAQALTDQEVLQLTNL